MMHRTLPKINIHGSAFFIDVLHEELQECENLKNRIPFDVFLQEKNGYSFLYDCQHKNAAAAGLLPDGKHIIAVTLPALMELDPEGISLKYNIPLEILCPEKMGESRFDVEDDFED